MKKRATNRFFDAVVFSRGPSASACTRRAVGRIVLFFVAMSALSGVAWGLDADSGEADDPYGAYGRAVWYVDGSSAYDGPGNDWDHAFHYLQDALSAASDGDEIHVAGGTHHPDENGADPSGTGSRTVTFQLITGVEIYGGYAGAANPSNPDERDRVLYETTLSGDLNGDDGPDFANNDENTYNVVTGDGTTPAALLDGVTITAGNANAEGQPYANSGGLSIYSNGSPTIRGCVFIANYTTHRSTGIGVWNGSAPEIINCTFLGNISNSRGGGIYSYGSSPTVVNCLFSGNDAVLSGGGGFRAENGGYPTLINCTLTQNGNNGIQDASQQMTVTNCIVWANAGDQINGTPAVTYSDVQGFFTGTGNIDDDPGFVDADGPDNVPGTEDDNLRLWEGSPCVDTGDNAVVTESTDLDGKPRIVDGDTDGTATVDMGSYEYHIPDPEINCEDLSPYDWGSITSSCSDVHYWTIINEGGETLNGEMTLTGPDAGIFEFTEGGGAFVLEPDASRDVGVRFCCDTGGDKSATLHITSDDPDENPCDLELSGYCSVFQIGGAIYSDLGNPLGTGEADVVVTIDGTGGTFTPATSGNQGLWQAALVPTGTYTVTPSKGTCTFEHVVGGVPDGQASIEITVDELHQTENQSIQFLADCPPDIPDVNCEDLVGHDFPGEQGVGTCSEEQTWIITNEGTADLTGAVLLTGADAAEFQFTQGGGAIDPPIGPGGDLTVGVAFCPNYSGPKTATLRISTDDPDENPCDLPLTGTGFGEPDLNCEDLTGHDFGDVWRPDKSPEHTWLIVNEGNAPLTGNITLEGADHADFEFTQGGGTFSLDPLASRIVGVWFYPQSDGVKAAMLRIDSNDPDEDPCDLALSGVGYPPGEPEINCEELTGFDYGEVAVTICSPEHTWIIENSGYAPLTGTVELTGVDAGEFEFTQGGGDLNVNPSDTQTVGVRFCPDSVGTKTATLQINSDDADESSCPLTLDATGKDCAAVRDLAVLWPSYCADDPKPVEISITPPGGATAILIEDQPPAGWVVSNISDGGQWDSENEQVKWGPLYEPFPTQVSYHATPPPGTEGEHSFVGLISIDGGDEDICGNASVDGPAGAFIPADEPQPPCTGCGDCSCATCEDGRVEACEMSGYACAYRRGCNDDATGTSRAGYLWMNGECYCWEGNDETWNLAGCPPSPPFCCNGREAWAALGSRDGSAERTLPAFVSPETWFGVAIDIQPPPGASVAVLEDQPPSGWLVRNISNSGTWDEIHGKVKWGPYFAPSIPAQVTYELLPPAGVSGEHCFGGLVSFDGGNDPIQGDACTTALTPVKRPMAEDCASIDPGDRCSASGTCATDGDCVYESHCVLPPADQPELGAVCYAPKARYISIARNPEQVADTARRVKLSGGSSIGWVGAPYWVDPTSQHDGLWLADIQAAPTYETTWPDVVHVVGCEVAHAALCDDSTGEHCGPNNCPGGATETCYHHCYDVQAIVLGADVGNEDNYSEVLELCTPTVWGDTVSTCADNKCRPPNGIVGLDDVQAAIKLYQGNPVAPITWLDIDPSNGTQTPNQNIGIGDILKVIDGFQGKPYPGDGPLECIP